MIHMLKVQSPSLGCWLERHLTYLFIYFHLKEFVCLLYKSHLEEIKNIQQQDILHILFSKALHCSAIQVMLVSGFSC